MADGPKPHAESSSRSARAFWASRVERFVAESRLNPFYVRRADMVARLVCANLNADRVLDVGCGSGHLVFRLAAAGFTAHGLDLSETQIALAVEAAEASGLRNSPSFRVGGLEVLHPTEMFEAVCALGVLPYIADEPAFLGALANLVMPRGLLVVSQTRAFSVYTLLALLHHACRFSPTSSWITVAYNLVRTGIWSGGFLHRAARVRARNPRGLDRVLATRDFGRIALLALYNVDRLDANASGRGAFGQWLAERLAWCVVAVYRRSG